MEFAYIPEFWGNALLTLKDLVDIQAAIYGYCDLEKLYYNAAKMLTHQGFTTMVGRTTSGYFFQFAEDWAYVTNKYLNSFCRAYHLGLIFSVIFSFKIN